MRINDHILGESPQPYVIAEIGVNHDGSRDRARELISIAAKAGAHAVKFQFFTADRLLSSASRLAAYQRESGANDPFTMLQRLELSEDDLQTLAQFAWSSGVHPIVTFFSIEHAHLARQIPWAAIKVASPDIVNRPLIEAVATSGKPLILSTGAATLDEVRRAATWLMGREFALMQCVSAYPTPKETAALGAMAALKRAINVPVGYSDHTTDEHTGGMAVAAGACMLEKHLTYSRSANGPDHAMSLDPEQFQRYVQFSQLAAQMLGRDEKTVMAIENDVREVSRQSIVAARNLEAGHVITRADLTIKRPGGGIAPSRLNDLLGKRVRMPAQANDLLTEMHIDWQAAAAEKTAATASRPTAQAA